MPVPQKDILAKCQKLEQQFPAHVLKIKAAICGLKKEELYDKKTIAAYAAKLRMCRKWAHMTTENVADLLGISRVMVTKYENTLNTRASVDTHYLELFSLIYEVSPLYLVGKTDNPLDYIGNMPFEEMIKLAPMQIQELVYGSKYAPQSKMEQYAAEIINTLYGEMPFVEESEAQLMEALLKVCTARDTRRLAIKTTIMAIPSIQMLMQARINSERENGVRENAPNKIEKVDKKSLSGSIENEISKRRIKDIFYGIWQQNNRHLQECYEYLVRLGIKDLELLRCFTVIANAPKKQRALVFALLTDGGFLEDEYAFVQNDRTEKLQSYSDLEISFWHDIE